MGSVSFPPPCVGSEDPTQAVAGHLQQALYLLSRPACWIFLETESCMVFNHNRTINTYMDR